MTEVRKAKRGDQKPAFTERDVKIFSTVLDNYIEIVEQVVSRSIMTLSTNRLTRLDYKVAVEQVIKKADLNRGMQKSLRKILAGEPCGVGSRNALVMKLTPLFLAARLFPLARFFTNEAAWKYKVQKQRENLKLSMTPKQVKAVAEKYFDSNTARHFGTDGAPLVKYDSIEPQTATLAESLETPQDYDAIIASADDSNFARQSV